MPQTQLLAVTGATQGLMRLALQAYELRHRVIANNIANVDSEGFRPATLNFEQQLGPLRAAVAAGASPARLEELAARVHPHAEVEADAPGAPAEPGEKLDDQLVALTQNTLEYETMLTVMARYGGLTHLAITGS
jgi:flagellar basal-body rod protein FlgB